MGRVSLALVVLLASLSAAPAQAGTDEPQPESAAEPPVPRGNDEFIGVTTTAPVTRRFEMYNPHSSEALQALREMGFTQVILDWPNLHPDATRIGLNVVLANWWTDRTPPEEIDRGIDAAQQVERGRLAGISIMDEPGRNAPDTPFGFYIDLYEQLRPRLDRELPGVRLEISHWGPLATWDQRYYDYFAYLYEAADVMRIMPYPDLHEGPLSDVYLMMLRSRELMKIASRELPLVVILQTWVLPPKSELPEIAELRVMAWQAMLGGAETLSFFDYNLEIWDRTPGFHDEFAGLMRELRRLSDCLAGATIESSMSQTGVLHARATWPSGWTKRFLVNTNRTRAEGLDALAVVECSPARPISVVCRPRIARPRRVSVRSGCRRPFRVHQNRRKVGRRSSEVRGRTSEIRGLPLTTDH